MKRSANTCVDNFWSWSSSVSDLRRSADCSNAVCTDVSLLRRTDGSRPVHRTVYRCSTCGHSSAVHIAADGDQGLIVNLIVQQVEGNLISPQIMGRTLELHPMLIVAALLIGGEIGGVLGLVVAVPLMAAIKVTWRHIKHLREESSTPPPEPPQPTESVAHCTRCSTGCPWLWHNGSGWRLHGPRPNVGAGVGQLCGCLFG